MHTIKMFTMRGMIRKVSYIFLSLVTIHPIQDNVIPLMMAPLCYEQGTILRLRC